MIDPEKKNKILIIEDEALVARELKSRLTNMGWDVVGIAYGREGIELARQTEPDLLLSDIHLKDGEDGIEMAQVIQAERDVPVVFLTAYSDEDTVSRAKEITPYGYIIKPVENRELRIAIDMALYKFAIEKELKETQQLLQTALTCIGSALVFVNEAGQITNLNRDAELILGRKQSEVLGFSWQDTLLLTGSSIQNKIAQALTSKEVIKLAPFIIGAAEEKSWLIDGIVGPMNDGGVLILRALTEITDAIEVLPAAEDMMSQLGSDRLTPIESSMCQLLIASGLDEDVPFLNEVSTLLNQLLRSTDLVSNYAGSQLSVSMPYTSVSEGMLIADSILKALQEKYSLHERRFSIGIAHSSPGDQQPFELFRHASQALKVAKDSGGNRVIAWDDKIDLSLDHVSSESEKQREYHNLVLLWNILNVVSKATDLQTISEKLCHHLLQSFDLALAAVLVSRNEGVETIVGVGETFDFSAGQFDIVKKMFRSDAQYQEQNRQYYFKLSTDKLLTVKSNIKLQAVDIEFLKTLVSYVATGLNRFEVDFEVGFEFENEDEKDARNQDFVFDSNIMRGVQESVNLVAPTDATVLIGGESGTGKEVVARAIHDASDRKDHPFILVDCGAVVGTLIESELFGHVKGAFTGADKNFSGRLREAEGGTVLLDEIGDLPLDIQVKILRFVQNREIASVGSNRYETVNTRVIAASHRDLNSLVSEGKFREDLYYRLNVFSIECPPLRKREGDINLLATYYLNNFAKQYKKNITGFTRDAERAISQYEWPGNIRELMNVVNRGVILCKDIQVSTIHLGLFPEEDKVYIEPEYDVAHWLSQLIDQCTNQKGEHPPIGQWLEEDLILKSLSLNAGVLNRAAQSLGIPESTLRRRVNQIRERDGSELPQRIHNWDANHFMLGEAIDLAQLRKEPVFDVITDALVKVLEGEHFNKKDAASLMGVSLPTYRRLLN